MTMSAAPPRKSRATTVVAQLDARLRSSLAHLPELLYAPLVARSVAPQNLVLELVRASPATTTTSEQEDATTTTRSDTVYAGWTGLASPASTTGAPVVLSTLLAQSFKPPLEPGTELQLTLLRAPPLPTATTINVTPCSPDDWELLAAHAQDVEDGLLAQVRAARVGATINVAVGKGDRAQCSFIVDSTEPPTGTGQARAVRLSTDTEVIIAPRVRTSAVDAAAAEKHDVAAAKSSSTAPPSSESAAAAIAARATLAKRLYRVVPSSAAPVGPNTVAIAPAEAQLLARAFGSEQEGTCGRTAVSRVRCPAAPDVRPGLDLTPSVAGAPARPTRSAGWALDAVLPERHVAVGAALREALGLRDWELVCFSAPSPGFSRPSTPSAETSEAAGGLAVAVASDAAPAEELAGVEATLARCEAYLLGTQRAQRLSHGAQAAPAGALLLTGGSGSGKSALARAICSRLAASHVAPIRIDCSQHSDLRPSALRARAKGWVTAAAWTSPSILWLDDVERIAPAEVEHADGGRSRACAEALVAALRERPASVALILTSGGAVHTCLNTSHIVAESITLRPPDKQARKDIIAALVARKTAATGTSESALKPQDLDPIRLASDTEGFLPADLRDLIERAAHQAAVRSAKTPSDELTLTMADFEAASEGFTPLSLRDVKLEQSTVAWSDIGGLVSTRQVLRETLEWPTKYAAIFAGCPLRLRSGLLLYGYPGCGKTLLASAVAKECGLNFIAVKGPEILNKYIGASEKSVRDLFDRAQAAKPCVLFFDEFDSIAPKRGHDSTGVTDRVVNQLLTQMDGAEGLEGVYVLAATSRPDLIDSALLRPGRLDKSLLCDMPNREDRADILRAVARKVRLSPSVDLEAWAERTQGYSGADLQALLYNAHLETIHESIAATEKPAESSALTTTTKDDGKRSVRTVDLSVPKEGAPALSGAEATALTLRLEQMLVGSKGALTASQASADKAVAAARPRVLVTDAHIEQALKATRPSVPTAEQARLHRIYAAFAGERDAVFPDGEASREIGARESLM